MRARVESRWVGAIITVLGLAMFMAPVSLLHYVPRFFFGAVLIFIAIDLMVDWLWHARKLVHTVEYLLIWGTFIAINALDLELGMLAGIGMAVLVFIFEYSRQPKTDEHRSFSHVSRHPAQHHILTHGDGHTITALRLSGYIFFGSAVGMVKEIARRLDEDATALTSAGGEAEVGQLGEGRPGKWGQREGTGTAELEVSLLNTTTQAEQVEPPPLAPSDGQTTAAVGTDGLLHVSQLPGCGGKRQQYLLLDFARVPGVDATAARSCFIRLKQLTEERGVTMIMTGMRGRIRRLLIAHEVIPETPQHLAPHGIVQTFDTLNEGLAWAEDDVIRRTESGFGADPNAGTEVVTAAATSTTTTISAGFGGGGSVVSSSSSSSNVAAPTSATITPTSNVKFGLREILEAQLHGEGDPDSSVTAHLLASGSAVNALLRCVEKCYYKPGALVYEAGEESDAIYFVRQGCVGLNVPEEGGHAETNDMSEALRAALLTGLDQARSLFASRARREERRAAKAALKAIKVAHERQLLQL
eukprot:UC1_evm1s78